MWVALLGLLARAISALVALRVPAERRLGRLEERVKRMRDEAEARERAIRLEREMRRVIEEKEREAASRREDAPHEGQDLFRR